MKKLITFIAVGTLAAGSAFAEKEEKKDGDKPRGERAEKGDKKDGDKPRGERGGAGQFIATLDTDKSGDVSFDEFKASPRAKDKPEDQVKAHFDKWDKDGDGKISQSDVDAIRKEMAERKKAGDGGERPKGDGKKREEGEKRGDKEKKDGE